MPILPSTLVGKIFICEFFLFHVSAYIEDMATFTAFTKYFCNTQVAGLCTKSFFGYTVLQIHVPARAIIMPTLDTGTCMQMHAQINFISNTLHMYLDKTKLYSVHCLYEYYNLYDVTFCIIKHVKA